MNFFQIVTIVGLALTFGSLILSIPNFIRSEEMTFEAKVAFLVGIVLLAINGIWQLFR